MKNTYTYEGRVIPKTTVFSKHIDKVPIETIIKLPTYHSTESLKSKPKTIVITTGTGIVKEFTHDGKGNYKNGKQTELDYLIHLRNYGKMSVKIEKI